MRSAFIICCCLLVAGLLGASAASAGIISAPYFNDFSVGVSDFYEATDTQWTHNLGAQVYNNTITGNNTASAATVQVTNLGGPPLNALDFSMSVDFLVDSFSANTTTVGFKALGAEQGTGGKFYLADLQFGAKNLRIYRIDPNSSLVEAATGFDTLVDNPYRLTLVGTYAANGNLTLSLTLDDLITPANTKTISQTVAVDVLTGQHFGLRNRTGDPGGLNVNFDNFSIVPEPSTFVLALFALAGMAIYALRAGRNG
jgi:hypothetical protein